MTLSTSGYSKTLAHAEIRNMSLECEKVGGINLSQGICDLDIPQPVKEGAKQAIDEGFNQYTRYDGLPQLRESIAKKMLGYNKIRSDPEKNIIVSVGSTGAFYSACLALLDPGDEVILFEPYYGYHLNTLLAAGAKPAYVKLKPPKWEFNMDELEGVTSAKTKGILINTPVNPCGKVFTKYELVKLVEFSKRYDLFIFTDEIYEYILYDRLKHISPASIPGARERTITISGYSKTFSITGWRIGYCVCDEKWANAIGRINDLVYICGPAPLQIGVSRGIDALGDEFYKNLARVYQEKRDKISLALENTGLRPYIPQGAYYVLADVGSVPGKTSKEKAMYMLKKTGVATVPGEAFYHDCGGENLVRLCFAKEDEVLDDACERIKKIWG